MGDGNSPHRMVKTTVTLVFESADVESVLIANTMRAAAQTLGATNVAITERTTAAAKPARARRSAWD